jgi:hypothetical protein
MEITRRLTLNAAGELSEKGRIQTSGKMPGLAEGEFLWK